MRHAPPSLSLRSLGEIPMPFDSINIDAIKSDLLRKLEGTNHTGLFLRPLVKKYALTASEVDSLMRRLTADGQLRVDSPWTSYATHEVTEVSFVRGEED